MVEIYPVDDQAVCIHLAQVPEDRCVVRPEFKGSQKNALGLSDIAEITQHEAQAIVIRADVLAQDLLEGVIKIDVRVSLKLTASFR